MEPPNNNLFYSDMDRKLQAGAKILVTDPQRMGEGRDAHIAYLVQIEGHNVRRRFSEFDSFRELLVLLNPTCIVPPMPSKEGITLNRVGTMTMLSGPAADTELIERRRVHLQSFLNRIARHPILSASTLFHRFLETPNWASVVAEEKAKIEKPNMFANMTLLPVRVQRPDARFLDMTNHMNKFGAQMAALERNCRRYVRREAELASDYAELGSVFQQFATSEKELSQILGKTGEAVDKVFMNTKYKVREVEIHLLDPMQEYEGFVTTVKGILRIHEQQHIDVEQLMNQLQRQREQLKSLEAQIAGLPPPAEPVTAMSLFRKMGTAINSMIDSNPQQTMRDNATKISATIEKLESQTDAANSALLKDSEAILHDYARFNKEKAYEFKTLLTQFADTEVEAFKKNATAWDVVLAQVDKSAAADTA